MKLTNKGAVSLKNLFAVIVTFAMVSILITFQSVTYTDSNGGNDVTSLNQNEILRRRLGTGSDIRGFGRSLNQHSDAHSKEMEQDIKHALMAKLVQIEDRLRKHVTSPAVALVSNLDDHKAIAGVTLKGHKLYVLNTEGDHNWLEDDTLVKRNWSVIFCSNTNQCPTDSLEFSQKADVIPALDVYVNNPAQLCKLSRDIHGSHAGNAPCCQSGLHSEDQEEELETPGFVQRENGGGNILQNYTGCKSEDGIVQWRLPTEPIMYEAGPLLRLRWLVTSFLPLRLYMSTDIQSGPYTSMQNDKFFKQSSIGSTLQHISETYGLGMSSQWLATVQTVVLKYFVNMVAESNTLYNKCKRCFQLLSVDMVCHSIVQCSVIQVSNKPRLTLDYMESVWPIVSSTPRVAYDVSRSLEAILSYLPFELCEDDTDSMNCMTDEDLVYILDDRKESVNMADWIKIYPTTDSYVLTLSTQITMRGTLQWRDVYQRHNLVMELQKHYRRIDGQNREFSDRDSTATYLKYQHSIDHSKDFPEYGRRIHDCSTDPEDFGRIANIESRPRLSIVETSPGELYSNVSYDIILVTVTVKNIHCNNEIRLENKYNSPGSRNITLGLGETKVRVYVMDISMSNPSVVDVILVTIHREYRGVKTTSPMKSGAMATCGLKQECSLKFDQEETCGLYDLSMQWSTYKMLPWQRCEAGDSPGRWVVPCANCNDTNTCYWTHSRWQPTTCSYQKLATPSLKQCLKGKKLLFIGDSTNRGILNFIIGRVNGSLWGWDKTHTIKVYDGVNDNMTTLSFAYYPHFWLPTDHRPKFHKVIYQIIKSSLPLENNGNTVLVVGGVQWLAKQHIDYIIEALQKKGLSNITKIVKGMGAGFHQPVEDVIYVPNSEQVNLARQEADILTYSKNLGFKVASTFNMTMARYKDFLEGKCACHFHKVTKLSSEDHRQSLAERQYSVTGEINAAYSDIVIDQICR